jgi:hypothetical protein
MRHPANVSRMKLRVTFLLALAIAVAVAFCAVRPASATPSYRLGAVLSNLRQLTDAQFATVVQWSRNGAVRPPSAPGPVKAVEQQISDLEWSDRSAVMNWLTGSGRSGLYARGASDADIGSRRPGEGPQATPNPYRLLNFASPSLDDAPVGHIQILNGFAAVRNDGKAAIVCISFKNVSPKTAVRVVFDFPLMGPGGATLATLHLDRRGTFSPNVDINGWAELRDWQSGIGHHGYNDNCTTIDRNVAATPLLRAAGATYGVMRVEYGDGMVWTPGA